MFSENNTCVNFFVILNLRLKKNHCAIEYFKFRGNSTRESNNKGDRI